MVQRRKLAYADIKGRKRRQISTMLNFQGQRKLTPAFQAIRKAPQGHREPTHCSATATHGRIRWPVYTSMHSVTCAGIRLLLQCNAYTQRGRPASANGRKKYKPSFKQHRFRYKLGAVIRINGGLFSWLWRIYVSLELNVWKKKIKYLN